jgi:hypothetical protein
VAVRQCGSSRQGSQSYEPYGRAVGQAAKSALPEPEHDWLVLPWQDVQQLLPVKLTKNIAD